MSARVGVVALQGDVREHAVAVEHAIAEPVETSAIRRPEEVAACDVIILPGGESTTISRLLDETGIDQAIIDHVASDKPMLATCAGLIVAAHDANDDRIQTLGLLDVTVDRNAYGSQRDSFEAPVKLAGDTEPFPGVFIRAPRITDAGTASVIATYEDEPVAVRDGVVLGASFHPELTGDPRVHRAVLADKQ